MSQTRQRQRQGSSRSTCVQVHSRQQQGGRGRDDSAPPRSGVHFDRRGSRYEFAYNESSVSIAEDQLWLLMVPVGAVVLGAAIIGPVVIGLTIAAVAIGAAMSAGAIFFTLPLIMAGFGFFMFVGLPLLSFSMLGLGLLLPKIMSLIVAGVGIGTGFAAVNFFLKPAAAAAQKGSSGSAARSGSEEPQQRGSPTVVVQPDPLTEEAAQRSRELREFDELLAERDHTRRMDRWRQERP